MGLVKSGRAGGSLGGAFLAKNKALQSVNKEQDVALEVKNVHEVSSFLLRMMDPGNRLVKII